jgi:murein DD-endopeptidase MepM/ murein hydrolase activator NlpD
VRRKIVPALIALSFLAIPSAHGAPKYVFPIVGCSVTYAHSHHDYPATDILAKTGCKYVAVTSGVIGEVSRVDKWSGKTNLPEQRGGRFVSLIGSDGVRYYGSHLSKVADGIDVGVNVSAGQLLGYVGNSGDARGTASHVHFGISWPTEKSAWWVRRGEVYPWKYLDAWKIGKDLSPVNIVSAVRAKLGEYPKAPKK